MKSLVSIICISILLCQAVFSQENTNLGNNAGEGGVYNVSIGDFAGDHTLGRHNVFVGYRSGTNGIDTRNNTFVGSRSGLRNTGNNNSFFGSMAGYNNRSSNDNTFVGTGAGSRNLASENTFVGSQSGYNNLIGNKNVFLGAQSGFSNSLGNGNIFIGDSSGYTNSEGKDNIFIGKSAGYSNNLGSENCIVGNQAGFEGNGPFTSRNSIFGFEAGKKGGYFDCVLIGYKAGYNSTGGDNNVFIGTKAGYNNESNRNTIIGAESGFESRGISSFDNTFLGYQSGYYSRELGNTYIGSQAGFNNIRGYSNVFLGSYSGKNSRYGKQNTFIGANAGANNEEGSNNTFLGLAAGYNSQGSGNIFIGFEAGYAVEESDKLYITNNRESEPLIYGDFLEKHVGIQYTNPGPYTFYVNGEAFATINWSVSDLRFKENIKPIESAMGKIEKLNGFTYNFKKDKEITNRNLPDGLHYGFIAQELQEYLPELVKEDAEGYKAVNYEGIIPVLVEALKELNVRYITDIYSLKADIENLQNQLNQINGLKNSSEVVVDDFPEEQNKLYQNVPNPFNAASDIKYQLSENLAKAEIYIYDLQGKQTKAYTNLPSGSGEVTIQAGELAPGFYKYCLIVNNSVADIKTLVVTE
jgi:hypothetical protein